MNLTDEEWKVLKEYRNLLEKMRKKEDERWKRVRDSNIMFTDWRDKEQNND